MHTTNRSARREVVRRMVRNAISNTTQYPVKILPRSPCTFFVPDIL